MKIFEEKNQDVVCPRCGRSEVHFNCKIGFYCMACERQFNAEEAKVLVEHQVLKKGREICS